MALFPAEPHIVWHQISTTAPHHSNDSVTMLEERLMKSRIYEQLQHLAAIESTEHPDGDLVTVEASITNRHALCQLFDLPILRHIVLPAKSLITAHGIL